MSNLRRPNSDREFSAGTGNLRRNSVIEKNGREYLVTINGAVFLALTLAGAEAIARTRVPHVASRPVVTSDAVSR